MDGHVAGGRQFVFEGQDFPLDALLVHKTAAVKNAFRGCP